MRKLLGWIVVTVGIAALVRKLRRRGDRDAQPFEADVPDPADELREKLASTREAEGVAGVASSAVMVEPSSAEPSAPPSDGPTIEERRAEVHDEGRAAIDEIRQSTEG
jgi:hypothetical protein